MAGPCDLEFLLAPPSGLLWEQPPPHLEDHPDYNVKFDAVWDHSPLQLRAHGPTPYPFIFLKPQTGCPVPDSKACLVYAVIGDTGPIPDRYRTGTGPVPESKACLVYAVIGDTGPIPDRYRIQRRLVYAGVRGRAGGPSPGGALPSPRWGEGGGCHAHPRIWGRQANK